MHAVYELGVGLLLGSPILVERIPARFRERRPAALGLHLAAAGLSLVPTAKAP